MIMMVAGVDDNGSFVLMKVVIVVPRSKGCGCQVAGGDGRQEVKVA